MTDDMNWSKWTALMFESIHIKRYSRQIYINSVHKLIINQVLMIG